MKIQQSETAIRHYHGMTEQTKSNQLARILMVMCLGKDYTIGEIAHILDMEKCTVSARRAELLSDGLVVKSAERKCKQSGVMCETVRLKLLTGDAI